MCLPQLKEAKRVNGEGFPDGALDWLHARYNADCASFETLLGDGPFFHGDEPGIGDCAIWGYAQWIPEAGVTATPVMDQWINRMRALPAMKTPAEFFPT